MDDGCEKANDKLKYAFIVLCNINTENENGLFYFLFYLVSVNQIKFNF